MKPFISFFSGGLVIASFFLSCTGQKTSDLSPSYQNEPRKVKSNSEPGQSSSIEPVIPTREDYQPEDNTTSLTGDEYFQKHVLPEFKFCVRCHQDEPGPIFSYTTNLERLRNNTLISVLIDDNGGLHQANSQCINGLNSSPCKEIEVWWEIEFSNDPTMENTRPLRKESEITAISRYGVVTGWAINPRNLRETITLSFYVNGDSETGIKIGESQANLDKYDNENQGNHGFSFTIPKEYANGSRNSLFITGTSQSSQPINVGSRTFIAHDKSPPGSTAFEKFDVEIKPLLRGCGCHNISSISYETQWPKLLLPPPIEGGSATNNLLYNKASGSDHPGGNQCAGNDLCQLLQDWWQLENP